MDEDHFPNCLSPVAMCSLYGYVSILRQLLSLQKNSSDIKKLVNSSNVESEWSPIMLAAAAGSKPTVQCLLERGADPNCCNRLIQLLHFHFKVWLFVLLLIVSTAETATHVLTESKIFTVQQKHSKDIGYATGRKQYRLEFS